MKITSNVTGKNFSTLFNKFAVEKALMLESLCQLQVMHYRKLLRLYSGKWKLHIVQHLNCSDYVSFSPWYWDQIGMKLGTKHVLYLKLGSFTSNKDVYVNRCFLWHVNMYFTEQNLMHRGDPIELNLEGLKVKQTKE